MKTADIRTYGASPLGDIDCSQAINAALESIKDGGLLYFPAGTYLVEKPVHIAVSNLTIAGDGRNSRIVYTYEQQESDDHRSASLFIFENGISDVCIRDMYFEYTGEFFDEAEKSYFGKVSCLNFDTCFDVNVTNVEIRRFNAAGVAFYGSKENYSKRVKIDKCYIHHCRVGGVLYGFVDGIAITNNTLEYHGSFHDGGTGYGCAGWSGAHPLNVQVIGNKCSFNARKGIDLHAGTFAVIEGNICEGNMMYGIYAEGSRTYNMLITGNIINNMDVDELPYLPLYSWIEGIGFGFYRGYDNEKLERNFMISENEILNFSFEKGRAIPFNCYYGQHCGNIQIKNNIISGGKLYTIAAFGGKGAHTEACRNNISITGNSITCRECTESPFIVSSADTLDISHNTMRAGKGTFPILASEGDDTGALIAAYNRFTYDEVINPDMAGQFIREAKPRNLCVYPKIVEKNIINGRMY